MALAPSLFQHPPSAGPAATRDDLLLAAWRKIIVGQADCPVLALELGAACGAEAGATHGAIMTFVTALAYAGRRRLRVGFPGCAGVTRDEYQLLALVTAAQEGAVAAVEAHLRWLTHSHRRPAALAATTALATELSARRLTVRAALVSAAPSCGCGDGRVGLEACTAGALPIPAL